MRRTTDHFDSDGRNEKWMMVMTTAAFFATQVLLGVNNKIMQTMVALENFENKMSKLAFSIYDVTETYWR